VSDPELIRVAKAHGRGALTDELLSILVTSPSPIWTSSVPLVQARLAPAGWLRGLAPYLATTWVEGACPAFPLLTFQRGYGVAGHEVCAYEQAIAVVDDTPTLATPDLISIWAHALVMACPVYFMDVALVGAVVEVRLELLAKRCFDLLFLLQQRRPCYGSRVLDSRAASRQYPDDDRQRARELGYLRTLHPVRRSRMAGCINKARRTMVKAMLARLKCTVDPEEPIGDRQCQNGNVGLVIPTKTG
jgi:hypothetical protein